MNDLHSLGFDVTFIEDLFNKAYDYRSAIPLLRWWLPRTADIHVKEAIVRALSVKWAKPDAGPDLVQAFRDAPSDADGLKWAIGSALEVVSDQAILDDLLEFSADRKHGTAREMIVLALGHFRDPRVARLLLRLVRDDAEVRGHAIAAIGRLRLAEARPLLELLQCDESAWIRREARKALKRLPPE